MHYTYILKSLKDDKWYTGCCGDLRKRFKEHNHNRVVSTKGRGPFKLIYYEACINQQDAYVSTRKIFEVRTGQAIYQQSPKALPVSNGVKEKAPNEDGTSSGSLSW